MNQIGDQHGVLPPPLVFGSASLPFCSLRRSGALSIRHGVGEQPVNRFQRSGLEKRPGRRMRAGENVPQENSRLTPHSLLDAPTVPGSRQQRRLATGDAIRHAAPP